MARLGPAIQPLQGRAALVIGVADGHSIAWGCARVLHRQGAHVLVSCLNGKALAVVRPLADALGAGAHVCDVEQPGALEALVEAAVARFGRLDVVVHSIAWAPLADLRGRLADSSPEGFARAMQVSCHSFAQVARLAQPHMRDGGTLVTMSYLGAEEAVDHYGLMGPVKAALESMVRYLALELGPSGIRVHAASPGPMPTRAAGGLAQFDQLLAQARADAPLQRLATPEEVGELVAFLAGPGAAAMTGQTLYVDGGLHAVRRTRATAPTRMEN